MIQVKRILMMTFVISAIFLLASTSAVAEYSQTQNKMGDKQDSGQQSSQSNTSSKNKSDKDKNTPSSSDKPERTTNGSSGMDKKNDSGTEKKGNY